MEANKKLFLMLVCLFLILPPVSGQGDNGTIGVKVTDHHNVPIYDATLYVQIASGNWSEIYAYNYTNENGTFLFSLPEGSYDVLVLGKSGEYAIYNESIIYGTNVTSGGHVFVPLKLKKFGSLKVKILSGNASVAGAEVVVKQSDLPWEKFSKIEYSNEIGEATISLPPGDYDIAAYSPEFVNASFAYNITVRSEETSFVALNLTKLAQLKVQVTDLAQNPISFAIVEIKASAKDWNESTSSLTYKNETADFYLPSGVYDARALGILYEYEEFEASVQENISLAEGSSTLIQVQLRPVNLTILSRPNLLIAKTIDKSEILHRDSAVVNVTIKNFGNATALNISAIEQVPQDFTIAGQFSWNGSLEANQSISYSYALKQQEINATRAYFLSTTVNYSDFNGSVYRSYTAIELITLPNRAPKIAVLSPNGSEIWNGVRTISWTGGDSDGDVLNYSIYYSKDSSASYVQIASNLTSETYAWDTSLLQDGNYLIKVIASDGKLPNEDFSDSTFVIDNTPPGISIYPATNAYLNQNTVNITVLLSDFSGVNSIKLVIDGIDITKDIIMTENSVAYQKALEEGVHTIKVEAKDKAGNFALKTSIFVIDTTPPSTQINLPVNNSFIRQSVVTNGDAVDENLDAVSLRIDGIEVSKTLPYLWDTLKVQDGMHEIKLSASDKASNYASVAIVVNIDNTAPDVSIISPANGSFLRQSVNISGYVFDANVVNTSVRIDGIEVSNSLPYSWNTTAYADGNHAVEIYAVDKAGNEAEQIVEVIVDNTSPELEIIAPQNNSYINASNVTVAWNASDDTGIAKIEVFLDNALAEVTMQASKLFSALSEGVHIVIVRVFDLAGNVFLKAINFVVDTIPPTVTGIAVTPSIGFACDAYSISTNIIDTNSGVGKVSAKIKDLNGSDISELELTEIDLTYSRTLVNQTSGIYLIDIIASDVAGNVIESKSATGFEVVASAISAPDYLPLWEKAQFFYPFFIRGKGNVIIALPSTYYKIPNVNETNGEIRVSFYANALNLTPYKLLIETKKGNIKEKEEIETKLQEEKQKTEQESQEKVHELEKELKAVNATITVVMKDECTGREFSRNTSSSIYDSYEKVHLHLKYKPPEEGNETLMRILTPEKALEIYAGAPVRVEVKVTHVKKEVVSNVQLSGGFNTIDAAKEEIHKKGEKEDEDKKVWIYYIYYPNTGVAYNDTIKAAITIGNISATVDAPIIIK